MYKVEYLPQATADILEIEAYLYELSPTAADRFTETLLEKSATLEDYPLTYPVYENDLSGRLSRFLDKVMIDHTSISSPTSTCIILFIARSKSLTS